MKKLETYQKKRDFNKTKEPKGSIKKTKNKLHFCVQHHSARKDHYDFRLEHNGVLLSWAVPKGPSYNPKDKRLAIHVEDHPYSYRNFEGTIPKGEYGGGTVMLWDQGFYELVEFKNDLIKIILHGERLKGLWTLTHFKDNNWLLIKDYDYYTNYLDINIFKTSIKTNRSMKEIANNIKWQKNNKKENIVNFVNITNPQKIIFPKEKITKMDIINYYELVAQRMLPYLENRIISVIRCPENIEKDKFFKKHLENKNVGIGKVNIPSKDHRNDYYYIKDSVGLISEVQMNSFEFHIWGSLATSKNYPNIIVFDLDPDEGLNIKKIRDGVKDLKSILDDFKLKAFLKTSGGKGYHVVVPIKNVTWNQAEKISRDIANLMVAKWPDKYTTNIRKDNRHGKIFIDYLRNKKSATSVAPYSIRLRENAPISMPIKWSDLDKIKPNEITMKNVNKWLKKKDPWIGFFN